MDKSKRTCKLYPKIALCGIILILCLCIVHFSPLKWFFRQGCLCGRAYFHAGEKFVPDEMLFNEIDQHELSDGVITQRRIKCSKHQAYFCITILGTASYSVWLPE